ncbi:MAG: L-threonylcarbamoyladenylate synthase [Microcoleaceae cyanobacterium]
MPQVSFNELVAAARDSIISFPTDTVPALAIYPEQAEKLFQLKQRSADKPLILMGACAEDLWPFVQGRSVEWSVWQQMADQYWPGALTLVLPAAERVPIAMHPHDPQTIGLRVPDCQVAREILAQTGPLATTSANLSGQPTLTSLDEIALQFPDVMTPESSSFPEGQRFEGSPNREIDHSRDAIPSTVVKWRPDFFWEILRQGKVKLQFKK